jgi:MFS family permease
LITTRVLIGVLEAGFYPTVVMYLSSFYSRFDFAVRIGLFYGQYAIANAFSGALCRTCSHSFVMMLISSDANKSTSL